MFDATDARRSRIAPLTSTGAKTSGSDGAKPVSWSTVSFGIGNITQGLRNVTSVMTVLKHMKKANIRRTKYDLEDANHW